MSIGLIITNITKDVYFTDENGQVFIPLRNLPTGQNTANINYTGIGSYLKASINVPFSISYPNDKINVTTWDVEMVQGKGVTLSAYINYKNSKLNRGDVYFIIDDKILVNERGEVLYAPVINNQADLLYDMPSDISLGNHTLTAVYKESKTSWNSDDKTLTIIENIPEGAGNQEETPQEDNKQETFNQNSRPIKTITKNTKTITKNTKTIHSTITTGHKIITDNRVIPADNILTLGELGEIFNQTFTNGHLLLYIDGKLVFNGTTGDDLTTVILEIIEKYLGQHEIKVEFTDNNNETKTYTENISIT